MVSPGWRLSHSLKSSGNALPLVIPSCGCVVPAAETCDNRVPWLCDWDAACPAKSGFDE